MFGIGAFELFAILVIAMIILGPDRLPKAMGTVGGWIRELRRLTREFRAEFDEEIRMLQGELESIREEAELTRNELLEIRSDIEQSMSGVQEDLEQAAEDIKEELKGAEVDLRGETTVPTSGIATPAPTPQLPALHDQPLAGVAVADPTDSLFEAIVDTFAADNGRSRAAPGPTAAEQGAAAADIASEWERVQPSAPTEESNWQEPADARPLAFSPQNNQFAAMLNAVVESGEEASAAARSALEYQAGLDSQEIAHLQGKGPAALAFAWAAQRQAVVDSGTVEIDASNEHETRIRLHTCPYGLTGPEGLPACDLSNAYDDALASKLGLSATYEQRVTEGAQHCELVMRYAEVDGADSEPDGLESVIEAESPSADEAASAGDSASDQEPSKSAPVEVGAAKTG